MDTMKRWAGLLAAAAGCAAQATPDDGVMTFPHVSVVRQAAPPPQQTASGLKAYKDPVTGRLVEPSPEQAADLDAAIRAAGTGRLRAASPGIVHPPQGGVGVVLDETHTHYAVARRTPAARGEQK
ncbi:hypothetical protein Jab_2c05070 [Janthinobacterium sp. HH01]|uniref:post-PEP-CTERM-1 domain-containing protein n=1 Tax=Janthinobacterium sp. HH01 TaxID=1198452 RepID=UPI0002AE93AC|nr:hypothetical protein [Janthinobacterium sp. HH01]ELX08458.1 hypothetical protein Jab_2c05070 [Janthinobacterium sp. HH01]